MLVKRSIVVAIAGIAALGSGSLAVAQGRDAAERGNRLEIDELRNDVRQERLKKSKDSGLLPQPQQNQPGAKSRSKTKQKKQP
jgi:hypothetical protein